MYVITFYSFKGGVGRTTAMVNAAAQLVKSGRNVLLVDFDLEAPGLDGFPKLRPKATAPGIVEYITDYLKAGDCAPPVSQYIFSCATLGKATGRLSIMPSGVRDRSYSSRLQAIGWQDLYSQHDGYLLFEDLKAQWEAHLQPDYVLIDSRTGHTDVGGICTRQLPDAVVLCFVPNEENIRGLESIVAEVRLEREGPLQKEIELFFVPSNVPYLDDEEAILSRRLEEAERRLHFVKPSVTIHRYDSLALLEGEVFSLTHPLSRLTKEYEELVSAIRSKNLEDRTAVLNALTGEEAIISQSIRGRWDLDLKVDQIRTLHSHDGEVIYHLAAFLGKLGGKEDAKELFNDAELLGYRSVERMIDAAVSLRSAGELKAATSTLREALNDPRATPSEMIHAVRLTVQMDNSIAADFMSSERFRELPLSLKASLFERMAYDRAALSLAERTIRSLFPDNVPKELVTPLMLCLIGQQKFEEAMKVAGGASPKLALMDLREAFNYAFAKWGASNHLPVDCFRQIAKPNTPKQARFGKNMLQCFAIAHWASDNLAAAREFLAEAEVVAPQDSSETFSCWRYLRVSQNQFLVDLKSVRSMIEGADILPAVFESARIAEPNAIR